KFQSLQGTIDFERDPYALNPKLDMKATANKGAEGEEITLTIQGRALSPSLQLQSATAGSQADTFRRLVGGSSSSNESTTQRISDLAAQQAATVASGQLSNAIGVDFELVPPPLNKVPLLFSLGKQISERFFVKFYKVDSSANSDIYEVRYE